MADAAYEDIIDGDAFAIEETSHPKKCPNLAVMDVWFDRLWTRQKGLYAMNLRLVFPNEISCTR